MKHKIMKFWKVRKWIALILACIVFANSFNIAYAEPINSFDSIINETEEVDEIQDSEDVDEVDIEEEVKDDDNGEAEDNEEAEDIDVIEIFEASITFIDYSLLDPGDGTQANPYIIYNPETFNNIRNNLSAFYKLVSDIDFGGASLTPIGTQAMPFRGSIDGGGHTISNFKINTAAGYTGLFGSAQSARFRDLGIENAELNQTSTSNFTGILAGHMSGCTVEDIRLADITLVSRGLYVGAIAGQATNATNITGCSLSGVSSVTGGSYTGGLVGQATGGSLTGCTLSGDTSVTGSSYVGGLVGDVQNMAITGCSVEGSGRVTGTATGLSYVGGLAGQIYLGSATRSFASVGVSGSDRTGGLIGSVSGSASDNTVKVNECYATGDVAGRANVGGLVGYASNAAVTDAFALGNVSSSNGSVTSAGLVGNAFSAVTVRNCHASGRVGANGSGLVSGSATVTSSYFDSISTGITVFNTNNVGKMTPVLRQKATYAGWDFGGIWDIREGGSYPYLRSLPEPGWRENDITALPGGTGTADDPYLIGSAAQFGYIRSDIFAFYKVISDIDFEGASLTPIGTQALPFRGSLDGGGYTISNFKISSTAAYSGLFGSAQSASFKDLGIENVGLSQSAAFNYAGILAGHMSGCTVEDIRLADITLVSRGSYVGAIAGQATNATNITGCSLSDAISVTGGSYTGGLIGQATNATNITGCSLGGKSLVTGGSYTGGLVGQATGGSLTGCTLSGDTSVTGSSYVGGLVGDAQSVAITGCSVEGSGRVTGTAIGNSYVGGLAGQMYLGSATRSFASVGVSGNDITGGLFGSVSGSASDNTAKVNECYASGDVAGRGSTGGLIGYASNAAVTDAFALGNVSSSNSSSTTGGLVGQAANLTTINNCHASGRVSINGSGLVSGTATVTSSYFDSVATGIMAFNTNNVGKMTTALRQKTVYAGWDFGGIWDMREGSTYPYLRNLTEPGWRENDITAMPGGSGTAEDPHLIGSAAQFGYIRNDIFAFYKLVSDIDFEGVTLTPIGTQALPFRGSLDGGGYTISNFKISSTAAYSGLFGSAQSASFKDLGIENVGLSQSAAFNYAGILAGHMSGCTVEDIRLADITLVSRGSYVGALIGQATNTTSITVCSLNGKSSVTGGSYTGGLVGQASGGGLTGCSVSGDTSVTGTSYVGGLVGDAQSVAITGCSVEGSGRVTGTATGNSYVGGLAGQMYLGSATRSFASVGVSGSDRTGGLIGSVSGSASDNTAKVNECYASGDVAGRGSTGGLIGYSQNMVITDAFALGNVSSSNSSSTTGGLVGQAASLTTIKNCHASGRVSANGSGLVSGTATVTSSYFDSITTGIMAPATQARTTEQMLNQTSYIDWDWKNTWVYQDGAYPTLKNIISPKNLQLPIILSYSDLKYDSVIISWSEFNRNTKYEIAFADETMNVDATEILIKNLLPDTEYEFKVRIKIDDITGRWSETLKIRTKKETKNVVGLHCIEKDERSITLTWDHVNDAESYEININNSILKTEENTYTITGLYPDTPYTIFITALVQKGDKIIEKFSTTIIEKIYTINPQTSYARSFIDKCEGQRWFIDETENLLNLKGKSINTINSRQDFATIYALIMTDRGISGKIPAAIGELFNLEYLYLANNNFSDELPEELNLLNKLKELELSENHSD